MLQLGHMIFVPVNRVGGTLSRLGGAFALAWRSKNPALPGWKISHEVESLQNERLAEALRRGLAANVITTTFKFSDLRRHLLP